MPDETDEPAPPRRAWPVRVGMALVVAVYLAYSSFGVAAPFLWGHHGYHGATYMQRAKMTLRFGMVTPATWAGYEYPPLNCWYFHHPIGYHHLLDLPILIFGDHEWVARGLAAVGGLFVIWALFALVRRHWSREAGVLACAAYVGLPILCSFSILSDPMLPAMACSIVTVDAFLRYLKDQRWKWIGWACAASLFGGLLMWEAYFQAVFHGVHVLGWALAVRKQRTGAWRAAFKWILATGLVTSGAMAFHLLYTITHGMGTDFTTSFQERHNASFSFVISRHSQWLSILYGWPLIALGFLWLAIFLVRLILRRARARDQAVLIFFQINVIYIILFAEGSSIHLYRVFWFSSFLALAVMDLAVDLRAAVAWLLRNRPSLARRVSLAVAGLAVVGYFGVETKHAYKNLIESREVMGTHGLPNYNADYPKQLFAMEVARRTGPEDFVFVHDNLPRRIEFYYYMDRSSLNISSLGQLAALRKVHPRALVLMDAYPSLSELKVQLELLKKHPAIRFDRYLMIDLRSNEPGLREYEWVPLVPSWKWKWLVSHKYPPMAAKAHNFAFTQCVYAMAQVAPPKDLPQPTEPNVTKDEFVVCHHNYQVIAGNTLGAGSYLEKLRARMGKRDVALGDAAKVVALRVNARAGADLWTVRQKPLPDGVVGRWRLQPLAAGKPALSGEVALGGGSWPQPAHAGYLYLDVIKWTAPAGKYRLTWEIAKPAPPPPRPVVRPLVVLPPPPPPPPPPAPPPAIVSADLGEIEIK